MSERVCLDEDREAVRRICSGDASGFAEVVERYFGVVRAVAYARLADHDAADDLAQEVFLRAYLKIDTLRDVTALPAWLITITRNQASHWIRSHVRHSQVLPLLPLEKIDMEKHDPSRPSPRENAIASEQNRQLHQGIMRLPEELREIVLLHYGEGLSQAEIARHLGVHPSTVMRQLNQALEMLRGAFENDLRKAAAAPPTILRTKRRAIAVMTAAALLSPTAKQALASAVAEGGVASVAGGVAAAAVGGTGITAALLAKKGTIILALAALAVIVPVGHRLAKQARPPAPVAAAESAARTPDVSPRSRTIARVSPAARGGDVVLASAGAMNQQAVAPALGPDTTGTLVRGRVLKPGNLPAAGATVNILSWTYWTRPTAMASSNASGEFEVRLPTGRYWCYAKLGTLVSADSDEVVVRPNGTADREPEIMLEQGGSVRGKVMDMLTNKPVAGALVITDSGDFARSADDGTYMISGIRNKDHSICAYKEGLFRPVVYFDTTAQPDAEVTLQTKPGGVLKGTVTDDEGKPIAGASVEDHRSGSIFVTGMMRVKTDAQGKYAMHGYDPDMAISAVGADAKGFVQVTHSNIRFPTGRNEVELNFRLGRKANVVTAGTGSVKMRMLRSITGTVTDAADNPLSGALVAYGSSTSNVGYIATRTDESGRFEIAGADAADDVISVQKEGFSPAFSMSGTSESAALKFKLAVAHTLRGRVVDEAGNPLAGVSVSKMADLAVIGLRDHYRYLEGHAKTDANGEFTLTDLPAEKVFVDFYSLQSSDVRDKLLEVGRTDHVITLLAPGQLSGTVTDADTGKPIPSLTVRLGFPKEKRVGDPQDASFPASYSGPGVDFNSVAGTFTVSGLKTASVLQVIVSAPGYADAEIDRVTVQSVRSIDPAGNVLKLSRAGSLEGIVLGGGDTTGPLEGARVMLLKETSKGAVYGNYVLNGRPSDLHPILAQTDAAGRFRFDVPYPNPAVVVEKTGFGRVLLMDVATTTVEVALLPSASVKGTITGRPGVRVNLRDDKQTYWGQTDADNTGSYEFREVPAGTYSVSWLNGRVYEPIAKDAILLPGKDHVSDSDGQARVTAGAEPR